MFRYIKMKYKFTPFSQNIIFLDTEFSSLNPYNGEILSIGLVKLNGEELYLEIENKNVCDDWVKKNILPTLNEPKLSREEAIEKVRKFVGKENPYIVSYVNQYDVIYTYKLFCNNKKPFHWLPIDFASILFGLGVDPEAYSVEDKNNFFKKIGIDASKYHEHNALDDARLLREVYLKMTIE
jgi:DNA polymerase III epsilon subunit-like protein